MIRHNTLLFCFIRAASGQVTATNSASFTTLYRYCLLTVWHIYTLIIPNVERCIAGTAALPSLGTTDCTSHVDRHDNYLWWCSAFKWCSLFSLPPQEALMFSVSLSHDDLFFCGEQPVWILLCSHMCVFIWQWVIYRAHISQGYVCVGAVTVGAARLSPGMCEHRCFSSVSRYSVIFRVGFCVFVRLASIKVGSKKENTPLTHSLAVWSTSSALAWLVLFSSLSQALCWSSGPSEGMGRRDQILLTLKCIKQARISSSLSRWRGCDGVS